MDEAYNHVSIASHRIVESGAREKKNGDGKIFMGTKDIKRQAPNVKFMREAGAEKREGNAA